MYKVPPLDFKGEDISIEFLLTSISGETPKMYAAFCEESKTPKKCGNKVSDKDLAKNFQAAKAVGKGLSLLIDHDENTCQKKYEGECYYTVVIVGQGKTEGDISKYSI